jgi:hypothetical protein
MELESINPGRLIAGTDADVTLIGSNFVQEGYTTTILLDGVSLTPKSITDAQIVVTIPATTNVGTHGIQVKKGDITSSLTTLTVASQVTISSAILDSGVITITGTGFGTVAEQMVIITSTDGRILPSDSISNWSDSQIVATSSIAAVGDTVSVIMVNGSGSAIIEAGVVPTPTPTVTPTPFAVISPNGGENWKRGTTNAITWTNISGDNVNIYTEFTNSKGKTTTTAIATGVPNSGSYSWNIPRTQTTGSTYKIKVTTNLGTTDTSDNNFQISK